MPGPLKNTKHERFVQAVFRDGNQTGAYRQHVAKGEMTADVACAAAARLLANVTVRARLEELKAKAAERTIITKEMLVQRMLETADDAKEKGVHSAAIRGYELLGREKGAFQDNKTVTVRSITGLTEQEILDELERLNAANQGAVEESPSGGTRPAPGREKAQGRTGRILN